MNPFEAASSVERVSIDELASFFDGFRQAGGEVFELRARVRCPTSIELQRLLGDFVLRHPSGRVFTAEAKAERANRHGNFFLERHSNARHPMRHGWMRTLRTQVLLYHFVGVETFYLIPFPALSAWAARLVDGKPRIHAFPVREQKAYVQRNVTDGWCVPIEVVGHEVGFEEWQNVEGAWRCVRVDGAGLAFGPLQESRFGKIAELSLDIRTHAEIILEHLEKVGPLDDAEARRLYQISRCAPSIKALRKRGVTIENVGHPRALYRLASADLFAGSP